MTALLVLVGLLVFGSAVLFVVFSNVYLELASRRARERRQQARLKRGDVDRLTTNAPKIDAKKDEVLRQWEDFAV